MEPCGPNVCATDARIKKMDAKSAVHKAPRYPRMKKMRSAGGEISWLDVVKIAACDYNNIGPK